MLRRVEVPMSDRPHDVTDLYLAPVLLAVDARITGQRPWLMSC